MKQGPYLCGLWLRFLGKRGGGERKDGLKTLANSGNVRFLAVLRDEETKEEASCLQEGKAALPGAKPYKASPTFCIYLFILKAYGPTLRSCREWYRLPLTFPILSI